MTPEEAEEYTASLGQVGGGLWRQILWAQQQEIPAALGLTLREWVDKRLGGYVRLAVQERKKAVAELRAEGLTQAETGAVLGMSQQQVSEDERAAHTNTGNGDDESSYQATVSVGPDTKIGNEPEPEPEPGPEPGPVDLPDNRADVIAELAGQTPRPGPVTDPPLPAGTFACIVIDPPWPVQKIKRGTRPWQTAALDYPVMTLQQIRDLPVPDLADGDGCHLYLWVTHKYLPDGLDLLQRWGFRYQCLMTWCKNTGMVPYSWMYDTEHVLFATRGGLRVLRRGLRLSFDEPVNGHSAKPDVFYDRVRQASPGPRLDMFARTRRDGFTTWGNEVPDADS